MHLSRLPRRRYTRGPTGLHRLPRLSAWLGGPTVWLKRDDQTGLTGGGNKTRKLEFLVADALQQGADTLVTGGSVQSNHCRLTLAASIAEGMHCHLVLQELDLPEPGEGASGNRFLFELLEAEVTVIEPGDSRDLTMTRCAERLRAEGRKPYVIPTGGSNAVGSAGYVAAAVELVHQAHECGLFFEHLVCASSSGGTHAGLVAGLHALQSGVQVTGVAVEHQENHEELVHELATRTSAHVGVTPPPPGAIEVLRGYEGTGYSHPTAEMREAVQQFARLEGVLLDPVYTGKAAAGLIGEIRRGRYVDAEHVVMLHTGGSPALFEYRSHVL